MPTQGEIRAAEMVRALDIKRHNAITALLTGLGLASLVFLAYQESSGLLLPLFVLGGVLAGLIYANAFEYALHRFLLHWGDGFLVQRHALHHDTAGAPEEARYVNFATSPWVVVLVFALNAPPVFAVGRWIDGGLAAGAFLGFTAYFVLYEEIHWRIHFGGWLPRWMQFARRHHHLHHGGFPGRYNVFLPIFDWIFERGEWKRGSTVLGGKGEQRHA